MILFCQICNAHQAHVYKGEQRFPRTTVQLWNCEQCDGTRNGPSPLQNATELLTAEQLATYQEMPLNDLRDALGRLRHANSTRITYDQFSPEMKEWDGVMWLLMWREVQEG